MDRFEETKLRIKEATDLVALIESYLPLKPRGRTLVALCPFHAENSPSFTVFRESQHFHCFGCGKTGDAFTWLMERDDLTFRVALWLTGRARDLKAGEYRFRGATTPVAVRGPAWPVATPVVAASLPSVTLTGEPGRTFQLRLNDTAAPSATPGIDGTTTITGLPWRRGKNQLCAVARNDRLVAESLACVDVYLTAP